MENAQEVDENGETVISMIQNGVVRKFILPSNAFSSKKTATQDLPPIALSDEVIDIDETISPLSHIDLTETQPVATIASTSVNNKRKSTEKPVDSNKKQAKKDAVSSLEDALAMITHMADSLKKTRGDSSKNKTKDTTKAKEDKSKPSPTIMPNLIRKPHKASQYTTDKLGSGTSDSFKGRKGKKSTPPKLIAKIAAKPEIMSSGPNLVIQNPSQTTVSNNSQPMLLSTDKSLVNSVGTASFVINKSVNQNIFLSPSVQSCQGFGNQAFGQGGNMSLLQNTNAPQQLHMNQPMGNTAGNQSFILTPDGKLIIGAPNNVVQPGQMVMGHQVPPAQNVPSFTTLGNLANPIVLGSRNPANQNIINQQSLAHLGMQGNQHTVLNNSTGRPQVISGQPAGQANPSNIIILPPNSQQSACSYLIPDNVKSNQSHISIQSNTINMGNNAANITPGFTNVNQSHVINKAVFPQTHTLSANQPIKVHQSNAMPNTQQNSCAYLLPNNININPSLLSLGTNTVNNGQNAANISSQLANMNQTQAGFPHKVAIPQNLSSAAQHSFVLPSNENAPNGNTGFTVINQPNNPKNSGIVGTEKKPIHKKAKETKLKQTVKAQMGHLVRSQVDWHNFIGNVSDEETVKYREYEASLTIGQSKRNLHANVSEQRSSESNCVSSPGQASPCTPQGAPSNPRAAPSNPQGAPTTPQGAPTTPSGATSTSQGVNKAGVVYAKDNARPISESNEQQCQTSELGFSRALGTAIPLYASPLSSQQHNQASIGNNPVLYASASNIATQNRAPITANGPISIVSTRVEASRNVQGLAANKSDPPLAVKDTDGIEKKIFGFTYLNNIRHAVIHGENGFKALPLPEKQHGTDVIAVDTHVKPQTDREKHNEAIKDSKIKLQHKAVISNIETVKPQEREIECKSIEAEFPGSIARHIEQTQKTIKTDTGEVQNEAVFQVSKTEAVKSQKAEIECKSKEVEFSGIKLQHIEHTIPPEKSRPVVVLHDLEIKSDPYATFDTRFLRERFSSIMNCRSRHGNFQKFENKNVGRRRQSSFVITKLYKGEIERHYNEGAYLNVLADAKEIELSAYDEDTDMEDGENMTSSENEGNRSRSPNHGNLSHDTPPQLEHATKGSDRPASTHLSPPSLHKFCDGKNCTKCSPVQPKERRSSNPDADFTPHQYNARLVELKKALDQRTMPFAMRNTLDTFLATKLRPSRNQFEYFKDLFEKFSKKPAIMPKPQ